MKTVVISFKNGIKDKVMARVDQDKFDKNSFGIKGYILKDGNEYGLEGRQVLVVRGVDEVFMEHAKNLLEGIEYEVLDENKVMEIDKKIREEEEAAQSGFGEIFG